MNLSEQIAATKRLQEVWNYLFSDLYPGPLSNRQFSVWLTLYGEQPTIEGLNRANAWLSKTKRRLNQDDLVRYASACAKNFKNAREAGNVDTQAASK